MRSTHSRYVTAISLSVIGTVAGGALIAGCSGSAPSQSSSVGPAISAPHGAQAGAAGAAGAAAPRAKSAVGTTTSGGSASGRSPQSAQSAQSPQSAAAQRIGRAGAQLVYTAQLTVRAQHVGAALARATDIVTGAGGYVSSEDAGLDSSSPQQASATVELKIPAAVYATTLAQLASGDTIGTEVGLRQQAQDETQQVANVTSDVASDQAAIAQLRTLLTHAGSIGDLLDVQNQINSEESDLESLQAQQQALNGETSYGTITLTIFGPATVPPPPHHQSAPGLTSGLTGGWHAFTVTVNWLLAILGAVAPFAAAAAVITVVVYLLRRRLAKS
jgi:hypothetical protein